MNSLLHVLREHILRDFLTFHTTQQAPVICATIVAPSTDTYLSTTRVPVFDDDLQNPLHGYQNLGPMGDFEFALVEPGIVMGHHELAAMPTGLEAEFPSISKFMQIWGARGICLDHHFILIMSASSSAHNVVQAATFSMPHSPQPFPFPNVPTRHNTPIQFAPYPSPASSIEDVQQCTAIHSPSFNFTHFPNNPDIFQVTSASEAIFTDSQFPPHPDSLDTSPSKDSAGVSTPIPDPLLDTHLPPGSPLSDLASSESDLMEQLEQFLSVPSSQFQGQTTTGPLSDTGGISSSATTPEPQASGFMHESLPADGEQLQSSAGVSLESAKTVLDVCQIYHIDEALMSSARFLTSPKTPLLLMVNNHTAMVNILDAIPFVNNAFIANENLVFTKKSLMAEFGWKPITFNRKTSYYSKAASAAKKSWKGIEPSVYDHLPPFLHILTHLVFFHAS